MRIAICVHNLTGGGAERVASLWAKGFWQQGDDVCVILSDKFAPITYKLPKDVKIYNIDVNGHGRLVDFVLRKTIQPRILHNVFEEFAPDIVIAVLLDWGPLIFKSRGDLNFKIIGTDHNSYERPNDAPMPKKQWIDKFKTNKRYDHVTVLTQADIDYIGNRLSHVSVLPNPLVFNQIDFLPRRQKRVLAVGRLDVWYVKGFDLLIKAFGKIALNFPNWELCIMGKGSDVTVSMLKNIAIKCGIENRFKIIPYQSNPLPEYRRSEVFCLSSRYEGFGMVLVEAMSQGCACIACDYKGRQKEIITDESCGLTCEAGDVDALANALQKMLEDDEYRKSISKAAIERSKYYNLDRIMERWEDIIQKVR